MALVIVLFVHKSDLKVVLVEQNLEKKNQTNLVHPKEKRLAVKCCLGRIKRLNIANSEKVNHFRLLGYAHFMSFHPDTLKMGKGVSTNKLY